MYLIFTNSHEFLSVFNNYFSFFQWVKSFFIEMTLIKADNLYYGYLICSYINGAGKMILKLFI